LTCVNLRTVFVLTAKSYKRLTKTVRYLLVTWIPLWVSRVCCCCTEIQCKMEGQLRRPCISFCYDIDISLCGLL